MSYNICATSDTYIHNILRLLPEDVAVEAICIKETNPTKLPRLLKKRCKKGGVCITAMTCTGRSIFCYYAEYIHNLCRHFSKLVICLSCCTDDDYYEYVQDLERYVASKDIRKCVLLNWPGLEFQPAGAFLQCICP